MEQRNSEREIEVEWVEKRNRKERSNKENFSPLYNKFLFYTT